MGEPRKPYEPYKPWGEFSLPQLASYTVKFGPSAAIKNGQHYAKVTLQAGVNLPLWKETNLRKDSLYAIGRKFIEIAIWLEEQEQEKK